MLRTAICDDCSVQTNVILMMLGAYQANRPAIDIRPNCFSSGAELLESMKVANSFDLFLLDILMPGINGIELAKEIRKQNDDAVIIFLSQSKDYTFEAFKVSAAQYILKPVKERTLFPILDKIVPLLKQERERYFMLSMSEKTVRLPFSSIVCVEFANRKLYAYLENGSVLVSKCLRTSFSNTISPLLQDSRFLHVHQSFAVNIEHVMELRSNSFITKNDIEVPIPRNKLAAAKERYFSFH